MRQTCSRFHLISTATSSPWAAGLARPNEIIYPMPIPTRIVTLISFGREEQGPSGLDANRVLHDLCESLDEVRTPVRAVLLIRLLTVGVQTLAHNLQAILDRQGGAAT